MSFFHSLTTFVTPTSHAESVGGNKPCPNVVATAYPDMTAECTGNYQQVLKLATIGSLTWNSLFSNNQSGFGSGWAWTTDRVFTIGQSTTLSVGEGTSIYLTSTGQNTWQAMDTRLTRSTFALNPSTKLVTETTSTGAKYLYTASTASSGTYYFTSYIDTHNQSLSIQRSNALISSIKNPYGATIQFTYSKGLVSEITDPAGNVYQLIYTNGNLTQVSLPDGTNYELTYGNNLITYIQNPSGFVTQINYVDTTGTLASIVDNNGYTTQYFYTATTLTMIDSFHSYVQTFQPGGISSYLTQEVINGMTTTYTLDSLNRLVGIIEPTLAQTFTYNGSGHDVASTTGTQGSLTETKVYSYDTNDNVSSIQDTVGSRTITTGLSWNACREPLFLTVNGVSAQNTYNAACDLLSNTDKNGETTSYTYDAYGNMLTKTDWEGKTTTYTYDSYGHVASMTDPLGLTTTYTRNALGFVLSETYPGGISSVFSLNPFGVPLGTQTITANPPHGNSGATVFQSNISWGRYGNGAMQYYTDQDATLNKTSSTTYQSGKPGQLLSFSVSGVNGSASEMGMVGGAYSSRVLSNPTPAIDYIPSETAGGGSFPPIGGGH